MKTLKALVVAALAAGALATTADVSAETRHGGARSTGTVNHHWSGSHRVAGTWGGHRHYYSHWRGGHVGFYFGVPLFWPSTYYWGYPYYYDTYYPRTVVYREVERYPQSHPEGEMAPSTEVQPGPGSPTQGPLYMNYCESAKAYYPKVASCPEGWKFIEPRR